MALLVDAEAATVSERRGAPVALVTGEGDGVSDPPPARSSALLLVGVASSCTCPGFDWSCSGPRRGPRGAWGGWASGRAAPGCACRKRRGRRRRTAPPIRSVLGLGPGDDGLDGQAELSADGLGRDAFFTGAVRDRARGAPLDGETEQARRVLDVQRRPAVGASADVGRDARSPRDLDQGRDEGLVAGLVDGGGQADDGGAHASLRRGRRGGGACGARDLVGRGLGVLRGHDAVRCLGAGGQAGRVLEGSAMDLGAAGRRLLRVVVQLGLQRPNRPRPSVLIADGGQNGHLTSPVSQLLRADRLQEAEGGGVRAAGLGGVDD